MVHEGVPQLWDGLSLCPPGRADALIQADPATSQLVIHATPGDDEEMKAVQAFGIGEDSFHLRRQQLGIERARHVLKREAHQYLLEILSGNRPPEHAGEIAIRRQAQLELHNDRSALVEAADKFSYRDPSEEYLRERAEQHAERFNKETSAAELRDLLESIWTQEVENHEDEARLQFANALEEVASQHSISVAETVTDVTLDIPYLVAPADSYDGDIDPVYAREVDLEGRLHAAIDALAEIDENPEQLVKSRVDGPLFRELKSRIQGPIAADGDVSPPDLELPLLSKPAEFDEVKYDDDTDLAPSEVGQIVNTAFNPLGTAGGVVYVTAYTEEEQPTTNWLVNPRIAPEPVAGGLTYEQLWTQTYVLERLCDQLEQHAHHRIKMARGDHKRLRDLTRAVEQAEDGIFPPLCRISPPYKPQCGGNTCMCISYVEATRKQKEQLVDELYDVYDRLIGGVSNA